MSTNNLHFGGQGELTLGGTGTLTANGGNITIQNSADVQMTAANAYGHVGSSGLGSSLTVTGINSSLSGDRLRAGHAAGDTGSILVENSASLGLTGNLVIGYRGDGNLTVQTGTTASADRVILGIEGDASGDAVVTGPGSVLSSNNLAFGGQGATSLGGTGTLTVDGGGAVQVALQTKFWTSASNMTINGGTLETDRLGNHTGAVATVSISDSAGQVALTVGTADGSSTFDSLIQDAAGGAGSIAKVGTGTFTLTNTSNSYSGETILVGGTLSIGDDAVLGSSDLAFDGGTFDPSALMAITRNLIVRSGGGTIDVDSLYSTIGALSGSGTLSKTGMGVALFSGAHDSFTGVLAANSGTVIVGDGGASGVNFPGTVSVAAGATVVLQDSNNSDLGGATLSGGLLSAANGIDLGATGQINGFGTVASAITGSAGSQINPTGPLSLGDVGSTSGFDFAGALAVGSNQVVILDADSPTTALLTSPPGKRWCSTTTSTERAITPAPGRSNSIRAFPRATAPTTSPSAAT